MEFFIKKWSENLVVLKSLVPLKREGSAVILNGGRLKKLFYLIKRFGLTEALTPLQYNRKAS